MTRKTVRKMVKVMLLIYVTGGVAMYFLQELLMFHPKPVDRKYVFRFSQPFTELNIARPGGRNLNIVKFQMSNPNGIVLYFHGNRQNIERYAKYAPYFTKNNYEVWMIDYPGYGKSTGDHTEGVMYDDALLFYQLATKQTTADKIIVYGKSLGTGVASFLASKQPCQQLILETPYYSMKALAQFYFPIYPTNILAKYSFPTNGYLSMVNVPVTIFHGTTDEVIPFKHAERLKKEHPQIELIPVKNGKHNNLYNFPTVTENLDRLLQ